jgi:hypothetical protein
VSLPLLPEVETTDMIFPLLPVAGHTDMTCKWNVASFQICLFVCLFDGVYRHFQQYVSYFVAVSFIGGVNQSTWRNH